MWSNTPWNNGNWALILTRHNKSLRAASTHSKIASFDHYRMIISLNSFLKDFLGINFDILIPYTIPNTTKILKLEKIEYKGIFHPYVDKNQSYSKKVPEFVDLWEMYMCQPKPVICSTKNYRSQFCQNIWIPKLLVHPNSQLRLSPNYLWQN